MKETLSLLVPLGLLTCNALMKLSSRGCIFYALSSTESLFLFCVHA